jgi:hypothetical protein
MRYTYPLLATLAILVYSIPALAQYDEERRQTRQGQTALTLAQLNRNRIAAYDRMSPNAPYDSIPEATLMKQAQAKHDRVVQLLQSAGRKRSR